MSQRQEELSERLWESHHKEVHEGHMDAIHKIDENIKTAQASVSALNAIGIDTSSISAQIEQLIEKKAAKEASAWEYFDKFKK